MCKYNLRFPQIKKKGFLFSTRLSNISSNFNWVKGLKGWTERKFSKKAYIVSSALIGNTGFFYKQGFFSTQPQCCVICSWIELQMLLRCCLIHIITIVLRGILHVVYLCPCLDLGLFRSYFCDLFFIFSFIFISLII